jgi:hypothetical protein
VLTRPGPILELIYPLGGLFKASLKQRAVWLMATYLNQYLDIRVIKKVRVKIIV